MDLTAGLSSLQFHCELGHKLLIKQRRCLTLNACAHCVFFCKLLLYTRQTEKTECIHHASSRTSQALRSDRLRVGIIGGGHLGKEIARCLIQLSGLRIEDIRISTRRPESLREFRELGVLCFYDNVGLTTWAQVIFVCCLPSQLPSLCTEIRSHVGESCIFYCLVSTIPLSSPFPWFDLSSVQIKETPFSQHLERTPWLQKQFAHLYCSFTVFSESVVSYRIQAVIEDSES
ncbi:NADP-dependent oxidoreductase domain-containing protein 1 [Pelodytes ibericus]